jgi:hypothetical protein
MCRSKDIRTTTENSGDVRKTEKGNGISDEKKTKHFNHDKKSEKQKVQYNYIK